MRAPLEDLASMALFASVVQLRSFSAAGRQLGLAKSAVSKRVALLEERLGVRLLVRTTRKLALTEDGVRYYTHCAALVASADAAEEAIAGASTAARGRIRVNAPVSFSQHFLPAALAAFFVRYPDISIELTAADAFVDVIEGGYDLVIRIAKLTDSGLVARRLATDRIVIVGAPSYLDQHGRPSSPSELIGHNCLRYSLVAREAEWQLPVRGSLDCSDGIALRNCALAGIGLASLPMFMVARDLAEGRLERVLEGARKAELGIYALFASRKQLPARTKLLIEHLATWFASPDWRVTNNEPRCRTSATTNLAPR